LWKEKCSNARLKRERQRRRRRRRRKRVMKRRVEKVRRTDTGLFQNV